MAFELLIKFSESTSQERALTKSKVIHWLESTGRSDFIEGVIDGVESPMTDTEKSYGLVEDERFDDAPLALFDDSEPECRRILLELVSEFGDRIKGAITEILDDSWAKCWQDAFVPLETRKFFIVPLFSPVITPKNKVRVELVARDEAFGTGQHATTRAVINILEDQLGDWAPKSLLDVGTGTGIYLILAANLGVKRVVGTEISEELANVALENCEIAGVDADVIVAERPSFSESFDLIVANILAPVLHDLMPSFTEHLTPGGWLILAGFINKEAAPMIRRAAAFGLNLHSRSEELGWVCLVFNRSADAARSLELS